MPSTRQTTSYLKGLAIIMVMMTHYSRSWAPDFYDGFIRDYAAFFVLLFFILSGYGIYFTMQRLEERHGGKPLNVRLIGDFFWQRALRIYPLFWLSLISAVFILVFGWDDLRELSFRTVGIFLAFPLVAHGGYTWFIPALIQCYLAAPLLYFALRKLNTPRYIAFVFGLGALCMVVSVFRLRYPDLFNGAGFIDSETIFYQNIFLCNILLFAGGLCIPGLIRYIKPYVNGYVLIACFISFVITMYFARDAFHVIGPKWQLLLFTLFLISATALCACAIAVNRKLPLGKGIAYLGAYSFALYLFHWQYFTLLDDIGWLSSSTWLNAVIVIALFPIFLGLCIALQKSATWFRKLLTKVKTRERPELSTEIG